MHSYLACLAVTAFVVPLRAVHAAKKEEKVSFELYPNDASPSLLAERQAHMSMASPLHVSALLLLQQQAHVKKARPLGGTAPIQLQTASEVEWSVPSMATMARKPVGPTSTLDALNGKVYELEEFLAKVNENGIMATNHRQEEYDKQIELLARNISHQQLENSKLQEDIHQLDQSISGLRRQAEELVSRNARVREDLSLIRANISLAQEYVAQLLKDTHEPLNHTEDLRVLHELAALDAATSAKQAHDNAISKLSKVALLQADSGFRTVAGHAPPGHDLLNSVQSLIGKLMEEQNASHEHLRSEFEKDYQHLQKTYRKLLDEWDRLNATKAERIEVEQKLRVAVDHLEGTGKLLMSKREALLKFAGQLSALPDPVKQEPLFDSTGMPSASTTRHQGQAGALAQKAFKIFKNLPSPRSLTRNVKFDNQSTLSPLSKIRGHLR